MFAPKIAKPKIKAADFQRTTIAPQRPFFQPAASRMQLLQRTIGNQALRRHLAEGASTTRNSEPGAHENEDNAARVTGREAAPSWDFSKIPVFFPGRQQRTPRLASMNQAKLKIGSINDPLEHEADRVAEQVMRMPTPDVSISAAPPQISRTCAECEEEEKLQRKEVGTTEAASGEAPGIVHEVLRSPGQPLDAQTRALFEPRFGHDFAHVRVHTGRQATESAREMSARAYASGSHIVFRDVEYAPASNAGRQLLAHELTHVIQQGRGMGERIERDRLERQLPR